MKKYQKAVITTYALVFGAIFLVLMSSLFGFILLQLKQASRERAWNKSLEVAEAGLEYYRWCLNNGVGANCSLEQDYFDALGNQIGRFSLTVESETTCVGEGPTTITSSGWTIDFPQIQRTVQVLYAKRSVAQYAYLLNDNVWAGADREIRGFYHSNGGIRMDGENQSMVTSAQDEWICTDSFGCDPCPTSGETPCRIEGSDCLCPGVFTTSGNSQPDLFSSPAPSFDFDGITIDLAQIKDITDESPQQYYWPPSADLDPEADGYHLILQNDGTFDVWIITDLQATYAYSIEEGWHDDYFIIQDEYLHTGGISIASSCPLVFIEDNLWIEGEVDGKLTVASADLINPSNDTDVVLSGNIDYVSGGIPEDGLAIIGENNLLIPPDSPEQMEIKSILIAQKGRFGRNHYPDNTRDQLEIYGSIVSNGRVGTKWTSGGSIISGYLKRENYFDRNLIYEPPLFVPETSPDFEIVNWQELE
ncbi:MAG: hypothetical protein GF370_04700 [Candidatus Nealsonbacteria bacterium]|nr:hypothetical protein [Candidatus Nealsonbacteria bacterium]